jgi:pimeloyl-ACP methyl ester carboxylesterase
LLFFKNIGEFLSFYPINNCFFTTVFHRILDFKRGWISILALFYFKPYFYRMKVYFISGLAADSRVFVHIRLPLGYEIVHLNWISPHKYESLSEYAIRLGEKINTSEPFALVGLSMGGMIATEIAKKHPPVALILLCSVPTHTHMPAYFQWAYLLRLHKLVPVAALKLASRLKRGFTADNYSDQLLIKQIIQESDPVFIRWAIHAILSWKNDTIPQRLWHIHGSKDGILPMRYTKPTHQVAGGNHLMIMSKAAELNLFLKEVLELSVTEAP